MGHLPKFNGDSKSLSLIIMILVPAEIGCYLFWLLIYNRSNEKSCNEYRCDAFRIGIVSRSVLNRIYRCCWHPPNSLAYKFVISVPCTTRSIRNGTAVFNIKSMHKKKTARTNSTTESASDNESIQAQRAMNVKRALCQLSEKVLHGHFSWRSALTTNHKIPW